MMFSKIRCINSLLTEKVQQRNLKYIFVLLRQDDLLFIKYSLLGQQVWIFFFIFFPKKWVDRAMGNETFNWDGLKEMKSATGRFLSQLNPSYFVNTIFCYSKTVHSFVFLRKLIDLMHNGVKQYYFCGSNVHCCSCSQAQIQCGVVFLRSRKFKWQKDQKCWNVLWCGWAVE